MKSITHTRTGLLTKCSPLKSHKRLTYLLFFSMVLCPLLTACGSGGSSDDSQPIGSDIEQETPNTPSPGEQTNDPGEQPTNTPTIAALPSRSSTIALTSDDRFLLVVNRQNNSVSVIQVRDALDQDIYHKISELKVGREPRHIALTPDNQKAYVSNGGDSTVSMIDLRHSYPTVMDHAIDVGNEPRGIAITPNGKYAFVANHTDGSVSVIQTEYNSVVNTIEMAGNPMAISITNDGDEDDTDEVVYVTRFFSELVDPINRPDGFNDAKQGVIDYFNVASAINTQPLVHQYHIEPIENSGFAADRRQFCQNTRDILQAQGDVVFFNSGVNGDGNGAAALKSDVFCPDNASTDASAEGTIAKTNQGAYPNQFFSALIRNGSLYLPNVGASPEPPVKFNLNVQGLVTTLDLLSGHQATTNLNNQIKTETQPEIPTESLDRLFANEIVAIDADKNGEHFLLVSRGGNYVIRASIGNDGTLDINAPNNVVRFQTGNIPTGVVMSLDGTRAYTNNEVNTSVTAIDLEHNQVLQRDIASSEPPAPGSQKHRNILGKLAFFSALGIPDILDSDHDGHFDVEIRDIEPLAFRGKSSDNAWSSCASCHDDGHSDNVTWIFPTGPRQTIALEGTFSKSNPHDQRILNWNAVRGSVTDFNNNSRGVQGGIGHAADVNGENRTANVFNHGPTKGISDALDAMTEWVANSVKALNMPKAEPTAKQKGRHLFANHCASCHGGDKWTKSSVLGYQNNPTFNRNPLGANFFALGKEPALDPNLTVGGPQIISLSVDADILRFLDKVGTFDASEPLEIRGAGAIGGGVISIAGDPNEGLDVAKQSTQGFASLGGAGFNTPSLIGVAYHSPYLHDGSAASIDEVFNRHTLPDGEGASIADTIDSTQGLEYLKAFVLSIDEDTIPFE